MAWIPGLSARILTHERARAGHISTAEAVLALARRAGLSASVIRGQEGWSAHGGARTAEQVELSDDLPIIIELLGAAERIETALPELIALVSPHGTITLTNTRLWVS